MKKLKSNAMSSILGRESPKSPMAQIKDEISIAILCGGWAKRFKGFKTFHKIGNKCMYQIVYEKLKSLSSDIFLQISNYCKTAKIMSKIPPEYKKYFDVVENKGPLGGIYSALIHARYDRVFIVAGDLIKIDENILFQLVRYKESIVVSQWNNSFYEPLCGLYSKKLIPVIREQIENGDLKISNLFKKVEMKTISIEDLIANNEISKDCFLNINSIDDLKKIKLK